MWYQYLLYSLSETTVRTKSLGKSIQHSEVTNCFDAYTDLCGFSSFSYIVVWVWFVKPYIITSTNILERVNLHLMRQFIQS